MSSRRSRIFPKAPKKVKQPQFIAVSEEHLPPPPPSPSRSLKELRKQTLARIAQEEEDHKIAVAEIEADVAQYQAHFGVYRQQNSFNFRINQDVNGDFHVTNVHQNNTAFEQFFETENLRFNHFLSQKGNDLFFHLNSQKIGGTSDYNDAAGNFNPTSFKRKYLEMDKDFRRYDRRSKDEYRVMLDNLNDAALESEYLKHDTFTYSDSWKSDLIFKNKDALLIAYIPSDCGKSTLFRNFKHYYFDLDHLCSIGTRKHMKYRFLEWFSDREKDYSYLFNFLHSEIFLSRKLLRGKILLAHSPHEIPENLRSISTEVKLMVTRPHLRSKSYAFDYASLDNYFTDIAKVFLTPSDMHFYLYNLAVALGYNPFKFR